MNEQVFAYVSVVVALCLGGATYALLSSEAYLQNGSDLAGVLLAIDLIALMILLVFVGRQIIQLISERKRRLAGYQLHWRLVTLFGLITVFPAIIVVAFSVFVLDFSLRGWFDDRISTAVNESVTVAESYLEEHVQSVRGQVLAMANDINREASQLSGNRRQFDAFLTNQAGVRNLSEALVINSNGRVNANSRYAYAVTFSSLGDDFFATARDGDVAITSTEITNRIRAGVRLNQFVDGYLLVGRFIDPNVSGAVARTELAVSEYQSLDIRQLDLKVSFALLFGMVALLLLLGAMWVGLNFANAIVVPLGSVIQVADQVRSGNLESRVNASASNDEIAQLGHSFNNMLDEMSKNRSELVEANRQLDKRREFTEAVLAGVSSGVIGIDEAQTITLPNLSALSMLGLNRQQVLGQKLADVVPEFRDLLENADKPGRRNREQNIEIIRDGQTINLLARITTETVAKRVVGYVVTFEDVSDLLDAQRKAAWSDIARRIAHEIKNPLTPIQLAAERLGAKYVPEDEKDKKAFSSYVSTIIRQVDDIGRLVNEFSSFARMPAPVMESHNVVQIINAQLSLFRGGNSQAEFISGSFPDDEVMMLCDDGLIRQAITNLLQNAVDAMVESDVASPRVRLDVKADDRHVRIIVSDNGPGLPLDQIATLTEPYVTNREKGTGLGLAIVQKIIEDHSGELVLENTDDADSLGGARVSLIFPRQTS
ncbi:MAG: PAS domain-containing sensor histidine kinase [Alphaproteobacteria bacterium]|nr:PAS domain-containing sensor histidine kinase [Alphaproteobacteria bacterium]